jgi:hypothetical protein
MVSLYTTEGPQRSRNLDGHVVERVNDLSAHMAFLETRMEALARHVQSLEPSITGRIASVEQRIDNLLMDRLLFVLLAMWATLAGGLVLLALRK